MVCSRQDQLLAASKTIILVGVKSKNSRVACPIGRERRKEKKQAGECELEKTEELMSRAEIVLVSFVNLAA